MADLPKNPNNREEQYLADLAGENGTKPANPWSRKEAYLDAIDGRMDGIDAKIAALATDISLKGGVADYAHLPQDAAVGDAYITEDTGILYVWVGDEWTPLNMQGGAQPRIVYCQGGAPDGPSQDDQYKLKELVNNQFVNADISSLIDDALFRGIPITLIGADTLDPGDWGFTFITQNFSYDQSCLRFAGQYNEVYKWNADYGYYEGKDYLDFTTATESFPKETSAWTALASSSPYTYKTTVTLATQIYSDSIVELINNDIVNFATYGFGILSVSGQVVTIASIGQPSSAVTLKIKIGIK